MRPLVFYVVGFDPEVDKLIEKRGHKICRDTEALLNEHVDGVFFTGGPDVHPMYYGEKPHKMAQMNLKRDREEVWLYKRIVKDIPKIGICRGGQFLNVMSGGRMWQHANGHINNMHTIQAKNGEKILVTSDHHQMMIPSDDADVIATANECTYKVCQDMEVKLHTAPTDWDDVEVCFYEDTMSLCYQPHPEWGCRTDEEFFWNCVQKYSFDGEFKV
jgi:gamma-glutamyl-gamma-aminobutyrate hydrolase PuuD